MKIYYKIMVILAALTGLSGCDEKVVAERVGELVSIPENCQQMLLVTSPSWESVSASLQRLERVKAGPWREVGPPIPVSLGRSGLGWGRGLHPIPVNGPIKEEGDGKAPAGVFSLGTAFGYAPVAPEGVKMAYQQATERDIFIDAPLSADYNQWVTLAPGEDGSSRYDSFEFMLRPDDLYELGVVVEHNTHPVIKGAGSAIFIHIWRGPGKSTAGCTAMSRENLLTILAWLEPLSEPILVQYPQISDLHLFKRR